MIKKKKDRRPTFLLLLVILIPVAAWKIAASYVDRVTGPPKSARKEHRPSPKPSQSYLDFMRAMDRLDLYATYVVEETGWLMSDRYPNLTYSKKEAVVALLPALKEQIKFMTGLKKELEAKLEATKAVEASPELEELKANELRASETVLELVKTRIDLLQVTVDAGRGLNEKEAAVYYDRIEDAAGRLDPVGRQIVNLRYKSIEKYPDYCKTLAAWSNQTVLCEPNLDLTACRAWPQWRGKVLSLDEILKRLEEKRERITSLEPPFLLVDISKEQLELLDKTIALVKLLKAKPAADEAAMDALIKPLKILKDRVSRKRGQMGRLYRY